MTSCLTIILCLCVACCILIILLIDLVLKSRRWQKYLIKRFRFPEKEIPEMQSSSSLTRTLVVLAAFLIIAGSVSFLLNFEQLSTGAKTEEVKTGNIRKDVIFQKLFSDHEKAIESETILTKQKSILRIQELVIKQEVSTVGGDTVDESYPVIDPVSSPEEQVVTTSSSTVMLHHAPITDAQRVYESGSGEEFTVIEEKGNWDLVRIDGLEVDWGQKSNFTFTPDTQQIQELSSVQSDNDTEQTEDSIESQTVAVLNPDLVNAELTHADEVTSDTTSEKTSELGNSIIQNMPASTEATEIVQELYQTETVSSETNVPYSVYLGSFQNKEQTQTTVDSYVERGIAAYWARVDLVSKGIWYRVFTGAFQDKESAKAFIQTHGLVGATARKTPYTVFLGEYSSGSEVIAKQNFFSEMGWSTYVATVDFGLYLLYMGAFHTMVGAEHQMLALGNEIVDKSIVVRGASGNQYIQKSE